MPGVETAYDGFYHAAAEVVFLFGEGFLQPGDEEAEAYHQKEQEDNKGRKHKVTKDAQKEVRIFRGRGVFAMEFSGLLHVGPDPFKERALSLLYGGVLHIFFKKRDSAFGV